MDELKSQDKPFEISKREVWEACEQVKANKGRRGWTGCRIEEFENDLQNNLYKIWNRMSSGTYFPPPVRAVEIPKPHGGGQDARGAHRRRPGRADGGGRQLEAQGRADLPPRLLRLPAGAVGAGRGGACRQRCWKTTG